MEKKLLRSHMKKIRAAIEPSKKEQKDLQIRQTLLSVLQNDGAFKACLVYVSYQSEVDTKGLIDALLKNDFPVYVPKVEGEEMSFYQIRSLLELKESSMGILEPIGEAESRLDPQKMATKQVHLWMILPGLAFDKSGNRLGYGGGFYDRYIDKLQKKGCDYTLCGVCYDEQLVEQVPVEDYDKKIDRLVTETDTYFFR